MILPPDWPDDDLPARPDDVLVAELMATGAYPTPDDAAAALAALRAPDPVT